MNEERRKRLAAFMEGKLAARRYLADAIPESAPVPPNDIDGEERRAWVEGYESAFNDFRYVTSPSGTLASAWIDERPFRLSDM